MNLTKHFTLEEMTASQTAARLGINNVPSPEVIANLKRTAETLERIRALLGAPLLVSSGYRSARLNGVIGGAANSAHISGLAVDFTCPAVGSPLTVARKIEAAGIPYDQIIHEYSAWVHLAIGPQSRRESLSIFAGSGYLKGLLEALEAHRWYNPRCESPAHVPYQL